MPPMTTIANGCWDCAPIRVESAAGKSPRIAAKAIIIIGRSRLAAPWRIASSIGRPLSLSR